MEGTYQNRYDVIILVNGLVVTRIELKRHRLDVIIKKLGKRNHPNTEMLKNVVNFVATFIRVRAA